MLFADVIFGDKAMKIPRIDWLQLTPKSLKARWPKEAGAAKKHQLVSSGLFAGKCGLEKLAVSILSYCVKRGGWASFIVSNVKEFAGGDDSWIFLPCFVRAGLLVEAGERYLVTDLLILWLTDYLKKPEEEPRLSQSVVHCIYSALLNGDRVNILHNHKLRFVLDS